MTALEGLRVLDLTANVAGPFATRILADLGADVLKVERPGAGDDTRGWGPPFPGGQGLTFLDLNRGKRSVELDLQDATGAARLAELVADADVFVQNLRPGSAERYGFGPDALLARHPRLVYAHITGYGDQGPRADDPAFDPLMQAFSGLMSITGEDGGRPARIPVSILDKGSGMWAAIGILAALRERDATGKGSVVHTSLFETALAWESVHVLTHLLTGEVPRRLGSATIGVSPYEAFSTSDAPVLIAAGNDRLWIRLCAALDADELLADPHFATNADRVAHRDALRETIESYTRVIDSDTLIGTLTSHGVPVERINTVADALREPQLKAVDPLVAVPLPDGGSVDAVRLPVQVGGPAAVPGRPAPTLGQHNGAGWLTRPVPANRWDADGR